MMAWNRSKNKKFATLLVLLKSTVACAATMDRNSRHGDTIHFIRGNSSPPRTQQQAQLRYLQRNSNKIDKSSPSNRRQEYDVSYSEEGCSHELGSIELTLYGTGSSDLSLDAQDVVAVASKNFLLPEFNAAFEPFYQVDMIEAYVLGATATVVEDNQRRQLLGMQSRRDLETVYANKVMLSLDITFENMPSPSLEETEEALDLILSDTTYLTSNMTTLGDEELASVTSIQRTDNFVNEDNQGEDDLSTKAAADDQGKQDDSTVIAGANRVDPQLQGEDRSIHALYPSLVVALVVFLLTAICIAIRRRRAISAQVKRVYAEDNIDETPADEEENDDQNYIVEEDANGVPIGFTKRYPLANNCNRLKKNANRPIVTRGSSAIQMEDGTMVHIPKNTGGHTNANTASSRFQATTSSHDDHRGNFGNYQDNDPMLLTTASSIDSSTDNYYYDPRVLHSPSDSQEESSYSLNNKHNVTLAVNENTL